MVPVLPFLYVPFTVIVVARTVKVLVVTKVDQKAIVTELIVVAMLAFRVTV